MTQNEIINSIANKLYNAKIFKKKKKLKIIVIAYRQFLKKTLNSINNNNIQLLINYLY